MALNQPSESHDFPYHRPPAFVRSLASLPTQMVDQILSDLPVLRILQILTFGTKMLKDCVLSNRHYSALFPSDKEIPGVIEEFLLYCDVRWFTRKPLWQFELSQVYRHGSRPRLGLFFNRVSFDQLQSIRDVFIRAIHNVVNLHSPDLHRLSAYSSTPCPPFREHDIIALRDRWTWIKKAKLELNAVKAGQLNRVADLISTYPGSLRLKKRLDPSQDGPRPNTGHIVRCFRGSAKKVLLDRRLEYFSLRVQCRKGVDCIEVIPYDACLWKFLETIEKYPPADEEHRVENLMERLPLDNDSEKFQYPGNISASILVVMKGLANIYTGSPQLLIPRIQWDPSVDCPSGPSKPIFFVDTKPHPPRLPAELHRCVASRVTSYDEREYEWLKAFLEVVTWMQENLIEKDKSAQ